MGLIKKVSLVGRKFLWCPLLEVSFSRGSTVLLMSHAYIISIIIYACNGNYDCTKYILAHIIHPHSYVF